MLIVDLLPVVSTKVYKAISKTWEKIAKIMNCIVLSTTSLHYLTFDGLFVCAKSVKFTYKNT